MAGIVAATVALQVGLFAIPQMYDAPPRAMLCASLMIAGVWVAIASAVFAAGPKSAISGLVRGGSVADATVVLLVVLWLRTPEISFTSACKLYCIYASVSLCAVAIVRLGRTLSFRYLLAVVAATGLTLLQAGLFWLPGLLGLVPREWKTAVATYGLRTNPLYGVFSGIAEETGFVWNQADVMYGVTKLGEDVPIGTVQWYEPMAIHLAAALVLGAWAVLRLGRGSTSRTSQAS